MRVAESITVTAPPALVWDAVADPARYLHFMSGVTRWSVEGEQATGLGARYRMLLRVGSAEVGGLIEVVEFKPARDLAWTSVTGHRPARPLADPRARRRLARRAAPPVRRRRARASGAGSPRASPPAPSAGTCGARCSSSSARSSTSSCALQAAARRSARTAAQ